MDKLLNFREEITESEYAEFWRRLNPLRKNSEAWNAEGQRIIAELEQSEVGIFRASDFEGSVARARRAAEVFQSDEGGKIIRRDSRGRFSKRGRTFQVIGSKK